MRHMKDLNVLDLSYNKIRCLDISTLRDINSIIHYTPPQSNVLRTFEINLSDNPLHCSCSCLEFYVWIRKVRHYITFIDIGSYQWTFDNGQRIYLWKLNLILDILHSQCVSVDWSPLTTTTAAITTIYMFILLATTLFRFIHTLRYIWLKHKMHREYLERHILDPKYRFDAFISCDRSGAIWVKRNFLPKLENQQNGLKFCVAQRDFIVGATIIDNIARSINQSRKSSLCLSLKTS